MKFGGEKGGKLLVFLEFFGIFTNYLEKLCVFYEYFYGTCVFDRFPINRDVASLHISPRRGKEIRFQKSEKYFDRIYRIKTGLNLKNKK